jgi:hypothetical protein
MSKDREWSAPRKRPLVEAQIDASDFRPVFALFRDGPNLADARKQVLRLLAAYVLIFLPLQVGVYVLAARSVALASAITFVLAAALAAVAVAKRLGLEELLQKLPLILVFVLVGAGLLYLAGESSRKRDAGSFEFFGTLFLVIAVVSVLGNLYQPLAAAYQTLTLKTPVRDLALAAAGLLVALALVAVSQALNPSTAVLLAFTLSGGYAALVVAEYVAWMRANPARSLDKDTPDATKVGSDWHQARVLASGLVTGFSYGLFLLLVIWPPQGPMWTEPRAASGGLLDGITVVRLWCVVFFCLGLFGLNASLGSLRWTTRTALCLRLACDALVLFLTYPKTSHPLAYRLSTKWLRPVGVRLALTGLVLSTSTTALLVSVRKPTEAAPAPKAAAATPPVGMTYPRPLHAMDDLTPINRWKADSDDAPFVSPANPGQERSGTLATAEPNSASAESFGVCVLILVLFSPALIYAMVFTLGMLALPHYYERYEVQAPVVPAK